MKLLTLLALVLASSASFATDYAAYPADPVTITSIPALHGPEYHDFRGRARELVGLYKSHKLRALAGRYVFTTMGCGTECSVLIGVDLKSGLFKVFDQQAFAVNYRPDSRLLVINKGGAHLVTSNYPEQHFLIADSFDLKEVQ